MYQECCPQASLRLLCSTSEPRAKLQSHFWVFKETRPPRLLLSRLGPLGLRATLPVKCRQPPSPLTPSQSRQASTPSLPHLGPVVAEDAHHADGNSLVQAAPQSFAVESKHKGDVLVTGVVNDGA